MNELALPRRRFPWPFVAAVAAVAALAAWYLWPRAQTPPKLTTMAVESGDVVARVTATGILKALVTVEVGSQVSGRIQELLADFNSEVKKGQVVARLDRQLLDAALTEARANERAARANVERAKVQALNAVRQRDRGTELAAKKLIAQAELESLELDAQVAQAQVTAAEGAREQAGAALHRAEVNLGYATIVSPIDGVVISRDVDVGQTVAASLQAPKLFTIAQDLKKMQVNTSVSEADIGRITAGMEASFTVDAWPTERFKGVVRQIRNAPQTTQNVVTYDVILDVDNPELRLRPGMTANVTFVVEQKLAVLRIPNAALRFRAPASLRPAATNGDTPSGDKPGGDKPRGDKPGGERAAGKVNGDKPDGLREVWVMRNDVATAIRVRTGLSDGSFTELVSGELKAGDLVVTEASEAGGSSQGGSSRMGGSPFGPMVPPSGGGRRGN